MAKRQTFRQDLIATASREYVRLRSRERVSDFLDDFVQVGSFPAMNAVRLSARLTWDAADDALDAMSWPHLVAAVERAVDKERRW